MNKSKKEKLKSACEESDRKERVEKVASILEGVHYKTETDKAEAIISFSKANLTYDEIENLIKPLRSDYLEVQMSKRGLY